MVKKVELLSPFVLISMKDDTGYIQIDENNRREEATLRFRCSQDFFKVGVTLTYFGFILWRFISLVLHSIHATDCFFLVILCKVILYEFEGVVVGAVKP